MDKKALESNISNDWGEEHMSLLTKSYGTSRKEITAWESAQFNYLQSRSFLPLLTPLTLQRSEITQGTTCIFITLDYSGAHVSCNPRVQHQSINQGAAETLHLFWLEYSKTKQSIVSFNKIQIGTKACLKFSSSPAFEILIPKAQIVLGITHMSGKLSGKQVLTS